jgi:hypothetical protein
MATPTRSDMWLVTVQVDGVGDLGVFDKRTGGDVDSDEQKYRPGGMAPPVSLGGAVTMNNVVLERNYVLERDHPIIHQLLSLAGIAAISCAAQPLDLNRVPFGRPIVETGKLKNVAWPDHDSTSSDPGLLHLEFVPTGGVA